MQRTITVNSNSKILSESFYTSSMVFKVYDIERNDINWFSHTDGWFKEILN